MLRCFGCSKGLLVCWLIFYFEVIGAAPLTDANKWEPWLTIDDFSIETFERGSQSIADSPLDLAGWTKLSLNLIVKYERNAVRATRLLGYLHVAMHDAIVLGRRKGLTEDESAIAAHLAAADALTYFFPTEPVEWFNRYSIEMLSLAYPGDWPLQMDGTSAAREIADRVVEALIVKARSDGAEMVWALSSRPTAFPGMYEAHPPLFAYNPLEALAGQWIPWVPQSDLELEVAPPPEFGSEQFERELDEVIAVAKTLTSHQRQIAEEWHLDAGSVTPAGIWNHKALEWAREHELSQIATVRMLAVVNIAMSDATIHCWAVKYHWWTMRPITAAHMRGDIDFVPALATPAHPSYISGHAAISGAAASVLAAYLPEAKTKAVEMAKEASMSRLYGGIHFRSDNENGLHLGNRVGRQVLNRADGG